MALGDDRGAQLALEGTFQDFQLQIAGRSYGDWNEIAVERALDTASGSFAVTLANPYTMPFKPQDSVTLLVRNQVLITGQIDALEGTLDRETGTVWKVGGRDRTADLVDCSALNRPGEWRDIALDDLARQLIAPFAIGLTVNSDVGARLRRFKLGDAETVWNALDRACRLRGLLLFSDARGGLIIERPGGELSANAQGFGRIAQSENLVSAKLSLNDSDRFSIVYVRGQQVGEDNYYGAVAALVEANALDTGVTRFRPLLVLAESAIDPTDAQTRARWETTHRAARAHRLVCTVAGWRRPDTDFVWQINRLVPVVIPALGISAELLVVGTVFRRNATSGTVTEITLARPDAFVVKPELEEVEDLLIPGGVLGEVGG